MRYKLIKEPNLNYSITEQVLTNRGIPLSEVQHYLNTTSNDLLPSTLLQNMREGAKMLIQHISQEHQIAVIVDSDADGYTSAALLLNYLNRLFPHFTKTHIQYLMQKGKVHGIILDEVPNNISLLVVPDAGSNDYAAHAELKKRNIDVLVIDHHEAELSQDACVINNQICDYPNKSLSGVGVVYKFCKYIDELLHTNYVDDYLDLVALGMCADMISIQDFETKYLVEKGFQNIRNPYFLGMIQKDTKHFSDIPTYTEVAFYIAPYINAMARMGAQEEKFILFESMLDFKAYNTVPSTKRGCKGQEETIVEQACRNCQNVKGRQTRARDASLDLIKQLIEEQNLLEHKVIVVCIKKEKAVQKALTGLIANELANKYQKPTLILNETISEETGAIIWSGSGRGYDQSEFKDFKSFLENSGLCIFAAGHPNAMGVAIADENIQKFQEYADKELAKYDFTPQYLVDYIYEQNNVNGNDILQIADLKHLWGKGVEQPLIAIKNLKLYKGNIQLRGLEKGKPTLIITLPNGVKMIKFKSCVEEYEQLYSDLGCVTINVVGSCEQNFWNDIISPEIKIEDYEIVGKTDFYF